MGTIGKLLVGAGVAGGLYYLTRGKKAADPRDVDPNEVDRPAAEVSAETAALGFDWPRIWRAVVMQESAGNWGALNRDDRGAGISWGALQFNQRAGSLGQVMRVWREASPDSFSAIWGATGADLLRVTTAATGAERLAVNLAAPPYLDRWTPAGAVQAARNAQAWVGRTAYLTPAILAAVQQIQQARDLINAAVGIAFDRSVNQGPGACLSALRATVAAGGSMEDFAQAVTDMADPRDRETIRARIARVWAALTGSAMVNSAAGPVLGEPPLAPIPAAASHLGSAPVPVVRPGAFGPGPGAALAVVEGRPVLIPGRVLR